MLQFSPSEIDFHRQVLLNHLRVDGRAFNQRRDIQKKQNILDNLSGSSYISVDHSKAEVYTGVKLKLCNLTENQLVQANVFLQISCMKKVNEAEQSCMIYLQQILLEQVIEKEKSKFSQLTIKDSKKHFLQMHIQIFLLAPPHLSLLETIYTSLITALHCTTLPKLNCNFNDLTGEEVIELTNQTQPLHFQSIDGLFLVGVLQGNYIIDLSSYQFESVDCVLLVSTSSGKVIGFESIKGAFKYEEMHKIIKLILSRS